MKFIAFDLETTGMVLGVDKIVEIGAIRFVEGKPESVFSTLVNPNRSIPLEATQVNHITDEMVKDQPKIEKILNPFSKFCEEDILIAHNATFDTQFLINDIKKYSSSAPKGIILDTLSMSKKIFPGLESYKLSALVRYLKIEEKDEFHRAEQDALYCGKVFLKMIQKISPYSEPKLKDLISLTYRSTPLRFPQIKPKAVQLSLFPT